MPLTVTGVDDAFTAGGSFPSWKKSFHPQHCTRPSWSSAHVWKTPACIATAVVIPCTITGVGTGRGIGGRVWGTMIAPSPSWP